MTLIYSLILWYRAISWFDIDATHSSCASRARVADQSRCRMISHHHIADQSHEYLSCNDFFGQGSTCAHAIATYSKLYICASTHRWCSLVVHNKHSLWLVSSDSWEHSIATHCQSKHTLCMQQWHNHKRQKKKKTQSKWAKPREKKVMQTQTTPTTVGTATVGSTEKGKVRPREWNGSGRIFCQMESNDRSCRAVACQACKQWWHMAMATSNTAHTAVRRWWSREAVSSKLLFSVRLWQNHFGRQIFTR